MSSNNDDSFLLISLTSALNQQTNKQRSCFSRARMKMKGKQNVMILNIIVIPSSEADEEISRICLFASSSSCLRKVFQHKLYVCVNFS